MRYEAQRVSFIGCDKIARWQITCSWPPLGLRHLNCNWRRVNMAPLRALDAALVPLAQSECNEQQAEREAMIAKLQAWIEKSPYLRARNDERLLLAFLRRSRYSLEETKGRIDNYYSLRNVFPEVLCGRQVDEALLRQFDRG